MKTKQSRKLLMTVLAWLVAGAVFFPIFWMTLAAFKTEIDAVSIPPKLFFTPTFENYLAVSPRHCVDRVAVDHSVLERGVLELEPVGRQGRPADRFHCLVLEPGGPVLGQAVGGFHAGRRAHPDLRLADAETTGARPDFRR